MTHFSTVAFAKWHPELGQIISRIDDKSDYCCPAWHKRISIASNINFVKSFSKDNNVGCLVKAVFLMF